MRIDRKDAPQMSESKHSSNQAWVDMDCCFIIGELEGVQL
jgi:hypothetical protein